jgi:pyruvate formate lyase activating enzyme
LKGLIFNFQRYSIHDGPGIRTLVFLKGCPLRCIWCCNPESQTLVAEIEFHHHLCTQCGKCVTACPTGAINPDLLLLNSPKINQKKCQHCGACVDVCPSNALKRIGEWYTPEQVLHEVMKDAAVFRRSGGGVTLSGGEPMTQPEFTYEILHKCYEQNIHTAIETTGAVRWNLYEKILPVTDLFLFDIKHMDSHIHEKLTGVPNEQILENARQISRNGKDIIIRIPFIPGINTNEPNLHALAEFTASIRPLEIHLMPFHQLGKDKYERLGLPYLLKEHPTLHELENGSELLNNARKILLKNNIPVFIGG